MPGQFRIGIDLGGTKLEAVLLELDPTLPLSHPSVDPVQQVRERVRRPTEASRGYAHILELVVDTVRRLEARVPAAGRASLRVGVGLPGHISRATGRVKNANTTCLNGQDLWGDVRRALGRRVGFDNDANCLTLAEATWGAARGAGLVFGVILGTGVGGGIAYRGEVWSGLQGIAGEWGHTELEPGGLPCYCGRRGCVETYLSGPGLDRALHEDAGLELTAREFNARLQAGEPLDARVLEVWTRYLSRFGRGLASVINILDPDAIVIGGGMSRLEPLYTAGRAQVQAHVFNDELLTAIVPATLGDAAGVYGAALIGE